MTEYDNNLRGALFPNDKGGVERRPDYRGTCEIGGVSYKIAGWKRTARSNNKPFLSLSFTEDVTEPPTAEELPDGGTAEPDPF